MSDVFIDGNFVYKILPINSDVIREICFTHMLKNIDVFNPIIDIRFYIKDEKSEEYILISDIDLDRVDVNSVYIGIVYPKLEPIPDLELTDLYKQCLNILAILESLNIVHLDFKLDNMGYNKDKQKIILYDFGNACFVGNVNKEPPELIRGYEFYHKETRDTRSDMWSFACMIYHKIYNYYPHFQFIHEVNKITNKQIKEDISHILNGTYSVRPKASQLIQKWNINIQNYNINKSLVLDNINIIDNTNNKSENLLQLCIKLKKDI